MKRPESWERPTLAKSFAQFLDSASFARRTRESYTDDLAPLLGPYGQSDLSVLTAEIIQAYLAHQKRKRTQTERELLSTPILDEHLLLPQHAHPGSDPLSQDRLR